MRFRQATDPEIDPVDALDHLGPVGAIRHLDVRVRRGEGGDVLGGGQDEIGIGLLELRDHGVAQAVAGLEVGPAGIGRQIAREFHRFRDVAVGRGHQVGAHLVQRAQPDIPAARDIEREQVGVDAHEIVADRVHDVEIDLLGHLRRGARDDRGRSVLRIARLRDVALRQGCGEGRRVVGRVEEGVEQRHLDRLSVRAHDPQGLPDQGMAHAIDGGGEFMADACVRVGVVAVPAMVPAVAILAADAADQHVGEFGEHDPLVIALVEHLGGLENLLGRAGEALFDQVLDVEVVVAGPDGVHGREREILVQPAIPRDAMVQQRDERVGVQQKRLARAHEIGRDRGHHGGVDVARVIDKSREIVAERHRAARQAGIAEDRVGLPVVQKRIPQRRQKVVARIGGVLFARQKQHPRALRPVAFPKELPDQFMAAIGLVLVDEGRCLVEMLRNAVFVDEGDFAPRQVGGIVGKGPALHARPADRDHSRGAAFGQEIEPVVEILAKGHEQDVGVLGIERKIRFLRAQDVGNLARVEPLEDRVDGAVAMGVGRAVARFGQPDEGLVGGAVKRIGLVVALAAERPQAGRILAVVVPRKGGPPFEQVPERGQIGRTEREATVGHIVIEDQAVAVRIQIVCHRNSPRSSKAKIARTNHS